MQKSNLCVDRLAQGKQLACIGTCPSEALRFGTLDRFCQGSKNSFTGNQTI